MDITEDPQLVTVRRRAPQEGYRSRRTSATRSCSTVAALRDKPVDGKRLAGGEVKRPLRPRARTLDNTETIAGVLARFVRLRRSYGTLNAYYRLGDDAHAADLQAAARTYLTDANLVVTTLSKDPMADCDRDGSGSRHLRGAAAMAQRSGPEPAFVTQASPLPRLEVKLLFTAGSAHDPKGKEGLAALTARMIAEAGSQDRRIDEIRKALFPMAAQLRRQVDREMTILHRRHPPGQLEDVPRTSPFRSSPTPGFRDEDFRRLKDAQMNALVQNLRNNNEEELGKERLQQRDLRGHALRTSGPRNRRGDRRDHAGRREGLREEGLHARRAHRRRRGRRAAGAPRARQGGGAASWPRVPRCPRPRASPAASRTGSKSTSCKKETRATAISFGFPIDVTRAHPDFAALSVARSWLGEHRSSSSHLYQRIREVRGMNYGDYAYIEAFPRGMFQFFPDANVARRAQIFEIWIRPVVPENAHMALRIAIHELDRLVSEGLTEEDFQTTRDYLMKNAYLLTSTQDHQLGYALDQRWYGLGDYVTTMREKLGKLTRADVNAAVKKHLQAKDLSVVIVTKDAEGLKEKLVSDAFSPITYDGEKPKELLDEDKVIGALKLGIKAEAVTITPVEDVFAK